MMVLLYLQTQLCFSWPSKKGDEIWWFFIFTRCNWETSRLPSLFLTVILNCEVFKVTKQDILNFAETYIGSPEERADVLKSYVDGQGDLGFVIDHIMLSTEADLETWRLGNLLKREGNPNWEIQATFFWKKTSHPSILPSIHPPTSPPVLRSILPSLHPVCVDRKRDHLFWVQVWNYQQVITI